MSFAKKIQERALAIIKNTAQNIQPVLTSNETQEQRMSICNSCEFLFTVTMQCKKCGCFVNAKTKLANAKCPINKWSAVIIEEK